MIYIFLSDIIKSIKESFPENKIIERICSAILFVIPFLSIVGVIMFASTIGENNENIRLASTHYNYWREQLPPDHPLKQDDNGLNAIYEVQSSLSIATGILMDTQEEIIKFQLSEYDLTELGVLDAYLNRSFDEAKPEYLLVDAETTKTIKKIKLKERDTSSIKLYRNGEELSFDYVASENMWQQGKRPELHELISLGFVKAYIQNPDIAKITSNQVTAITKGKTKLILIYGTQLLECNIIVN